MLCTSFLFSLVLILPLFILVISFLTNYFFHELKHFDKAIQPVFSG